MSLISETQRPGQADRADSSGASSTNADQDSQLFDPSPTGCGNAPAPTRKTISCVSCRKRKLKCDRIKPKCGTCKRLRHDCEYPERKRNLGSKRRNMRELEARLAEVEGKLVSEAAVSTTSLPTTTAHNLEADWDALEMEMTIDAGDGGLLDPSFDVSQTGYSFQAGPSMPVEDFFSQDVIALGLQEPLPPQDMVVELDQLYFDTYHTTTPLMHKYRYYASLDRAPHMRPPICLRYAMWTMAASISDKYAGFEDILYERARRYTEAAEMKGHGEAFVSIYYVQTWVIISCYEAKKTLFSRSWMSTGRATRLAHMLGLHRIDADGVETKRILPPARDWIELEERRRTFWGAFYGDRWASAGTGWPMIVDEKEIMTNLPASEEAFENGVMQQTIRLEDAFTPNGASKVSSFGGVILSAALFGHNFQHLHRVGPHEHPEDLTNGEFWKRHRKMDNVLSNTFMFLPDHLRLPAGLRDMNVTFLHMNIHASTICLHQAATLTAEKHKVDSSFIRQSRARSLMAAEEISNIMRLISHVDGSKLNTWVGFCLYVAAGVFIQDQKSEHSQPQSLNNLEFLLSAMHAIGHYHSVTKHFTAQLELDIEAAGIFKLSDKPIINKPIDEPLSERQGVPTSVVDLRSLAEAMRSNSTKCVDETDIFHTTFTGVLPHSSTDVTVQVPPQIFNPLPAHGPHWNATPCDSKDANQRNSQSKRTPLGYIPAAAIYPHANGILHGFGSPTDFDNIDQNTGPLASNTPASDSSGSSTMQYPYRQADSIPREKPLFAFIPDAKSLTIPSEWKEQDASALLENTALVDAELQAFLDSQIWNQVAENC